MKSFKLLLLAAGLTAGLTACATLGRDFPRDFASKIVIGKTSRGEVEAVLGQPFRTGLDSGDPTASYLYYRLGLFYHPTTKDLTVTYGPQGVVKSYTYNANVPETAEPGDAHGR